MNLRTNRDLIVRLMVRHNLMHSDIAKLGQVSWHTVSAWLKPPTSKTHNPPSAMTVEFLYLKCKARLPIWFKRERWRFPKTIRWIEPAE